MVSKFAISIAQETPTAVEEEKTTRLDHNSLINCAFTSVERVLLAPQETNLYNMIKILQYPKSVPHCETRSRLSCQTGPP